MKFPNCNRYGSSSVEFFPSVLITFTCFLKNVVSREVLILCQCINPACLSIFQTYHIAGLHKEGSSAARPRSPPSVAQSAHGGCQCPPECCFLRLARKKLPWKRWLPGTLPVVPVTAAVIILALCYCLCKFGLLSS